MLLIILTTYLKIIFLFWKKIKINEKMAQKYLNILGQIVAIKMMTLFF